MKRKTIWFGPFIRSADDYLNRQLSRIPLRRLPYVLAMFCLALSVAIGVFLFSWDVPHKDVGTLTAPGGLSSVTERLPEGDPWRAADALYRANGFLDSLNHLGPEAMENIYRDKLNPQQ